MSWIFKTVLLVILIGAILISGCTDEKNTMLQTSSSLPTPSQTSEPEVEELSPFEDELVGKWSRYHAYDDSTEYYIFKSDRTACYFEEIDGSRKNKKSYNYWKLDPLGNDRFEIVYRTSSGLFWSKDIYDYDNDELIRGGRKTLTMKRSSTSESC